MGLICHGSKIKILDPPSTFKSMFDVTSMDFKNHGKSWHQYCRAHVPEECMKHNKETFSLIEVKMMNKLERSVTKPVLTSFLST